MAVATSMLWILLRLFICCYAVQQPTNSNEQQTPPPLCKGDTCTIHPHDFKYLQGIIRSNILVILKGVVFNVDKRYSSIIIENVTNLTISGGESGTHMQCSPQSTFGFHLKNATNISLTGVTISNCGCIPNHLSQYIQRMQPHYDLSTQQIPATAVLIESSLNILLSRVNIEYSPVNALTVIEFPTDEKSEDPLVSMGPHLTLTDCTISHSKGDAFVIYGSKSVLIERSAIANSSTGIVSFNADVIIKDFDSVNCSSYLKGGHVVVRGRLTMNQSSLNITELDLLISGSPVIFNGINSQHGLTAYSAQLQIAENSKFVFTGFNITDNDSSAMRIVESSLKISNSSLTFTENSITSGSAEHIFFPDNEMNRVNESSMLNSVSGMLFLFNSTIALSAGRLLFQENVCKNSSSLIMSIDTNTELENGSFVNLTQNKISRKACVFYNDRTLLSVSESSFVFSNNSVTNEGKGLVYINSVVNLTASKFLFQENECKNSSILMETVTTHTKVKEGSLVHFIQNKVHKLSYLLSLHAGSLAITESSVVVTNNSVTSGGHVFHCNYSTTVMSEAKLLFNENNCTNGSLMESSNATIKVMKQSVVNFTHNNFNQKSWVFKNQRVNLYINESSLAITNNSVTRESTGYFCLATNTTMENKAIFNYSGNNIHDSHTFYYSLGSWTMSSDSKLSVLDNTGDQSLIFDSTKAFFSGTVRIANNNITYFGAQSFVSSTAWFSGSLEMEGNIGGGIYARNSELFITDMASFSDNYASNGGAMVLISSVVYISPTATVNFTRNRAQFIGGAIFISEPRTELVKHIEKGGIDLAATCSIQVLPANSSDSCQFFSLTFNQNKAGTAGNAVYGGRTSACLPCGKDYCYNCSVPDASDLYLYSGVNDSSDLSNFTSDPTRVCFCENGIPDCYKVLKPMPVHPGEHFTLSLAIVGYGLGTVPGSVIARSSGGEGRVSTQSLLESQLEQAQDIRGTECQDVGYSIVSERDGEQIALTVETESLVKSVKEAQAVVYFQQTREAGGSIAHYYNTLYEDFFHIPVFVDVDLLPCPVGFQLVRGKCVCHKILQENHIDTCFFSNGTALILRPAPYWIGLPNDTNLSILIHPHCPYDYCQSEDINITAESTNTQCQYQRSGVLCGGCREGLSMILGSSECKACSNLYLVSITVFLFMGMALVTLVTLLNMTVSVGTLNGLILFANILQANRTTFLPLATSNTSAFIRFLSAFIAWLNLDLGISMCFFEGLTTYVKTWLQFVFPLYILALVGAIIIASNCSTRVTRLLGTNAVSVLATLVLLSYTKILRVLITAFSFTTLTGSQGYHSVVWLADGNIKYFELKHAILFLVALLVLLLCGVPYTVTLTAAPWIQRSSFKRVSYLYNKFKPLFDAYMGPYKDSHRYWTGMLLLARVVLIVLFSCIANINTVAGPQLNLLLLTLSSSALVGLTAYLKPYKRRLLNRLEIFHLTLLVIFASSNLYVSHTGTGIGLRAYIYIVLVGACFLVFLGICLGHIWYRVQKARSGRRPEPQLEREEEEYRPLVWRRARVRSENEEKEEVTMSTAGATNTITYGGRRDSLVELIANADIP